MDWMEQEQERGITITSAATTLSGSMQAISSRSTLLTLRDTLTSLWKLNASLRVLDGGSYFLCCRCVEPQSETVWRQADKYNVPVSVM